MSTRAETRETSGLPSQENRRGSHPLPQQQAIRSAYPPCEMSLEEDEAKINCTEK